MKTLNTIFIPSAEYERIKSSEFGTIDPSQVNHERLCDDDIEIQENTFGAISPGDYKSVSPRIVWLLKESYDKCDKDTKGGHNQALEYNQAPWGDVNRTYERIIYSSYMILHDISYGSALQVDRDKLEETFRKHVAIVNINRYPALIHTKSDDTLIAEWAIIERSRIESELSLLNPNIIICGFTFQHFFEEAKDNHSSDNVRKDLRAGMKIMGYDIPEEKFIALNPEIDKTGNYLFNTKSGELIVDGYHPAYLGIGTENYCDELYHSLKAAKKHFAFAVK